MAQEIAPALLPLSERHDADLFILSGDISNSIADSLIALVLDRKARGISRSNVFLVLTTYGGDPDASFRLARCLQKQYKRFLLAVFGYCKSAGTLIALGADEIIMSEYGELGPLDVQLLREDEMTRTSGLNYLAALAHLQDHAHEAWETQFLRIKARSQNSISTKTAAEISTALTEALIAPIVAQIDPLRLGEVNRASAIAIDYGERLCKNSDVVVRLTSDYSSHEFVIDLEEAQDLFKDSKTVRAPEPDERALEQCLHEYVRYQCKPPVVDCLSGFLEQMNNESTSSSVVDNSVVDSSQQEDSDEPPAREDDNASNHADHQNPDRVGSSSSDAGEGP